MDDRAAGPSLPIASPGAYALAMLSGTSRKFASLAVIVALVVVAFVIGRASKSAGAQVIEGPGIGFVRGSDGTAYIGVHEPLRAQPHGFAYLVPSSIPWIDASGAVHSGSTAPCLTRGSGRIRAMEAVKFPIQGAFMGTVVWVRC